MPTVTPPTSPPAGDLFADIRADYERQLMEAVHDYNDTLMDINTTFLEQQSDALKVSIEADRIHYDARLGFCYRKDNGGFAFADDVQFLLAAMRERAALTVSDDGSVQLAGGSP